MASCRVSIRWEKRELATCKGNGSPVSAEESNKALIREFFEEAWLKGNVAAVDEFMAADYVEHPRPSTLPPGPEGLRHLIASYRTAFPDLKMTLDDIFGEGEMVAYRWSVSGTHLGEWLGTTPTGNHVRATGITIFRIAGGNASSRNCASPARSNKRSCPTGFTLVASTSALIFFVARYESQTTKSLELHFCALLSEDGVRDVRFERVLCT